MGGSRERNLQFRTTLRDSQCTALKDYNIPRSVGERCNHLRPAVTSLIRAGDSKRGNRVALGNVCTVQCAKLKGYRYNNAPARFDIDHQSGGQQRAYRVVSSCNRHGGGAFLHVLSRNSGPSDDDTLASRRGSLLPAMYPSRARVSQAASVR
jgi:hypothetical protein